MVLFIIWMVLLVAAGCTHIFAVSYGTFVGSSSEFWRGSLIGLESAVCWSRMDLTAVNSCGLSSFSKLAWACSHGSHRVPGDRLEAGKPSEAQAWNRCVITFITFRCPEQITRPTYMPGNQEIDSISWWEELQSYITGCMDTQKRGLLGPVLQWGYYYVGPQLMWKNTWK